MEELVGVIVEEVFAIVGSHAMWKNRV